MAAPIQKLVSLTSKLFGRLSTEKITKDHLAPLVHSMNDITAEDLMFDASEIEKRDLSKQHEEGLEGFDNEIAPVTYMHLHQERTFSMSVFVLKSGGVLPLHDHPKMFGLLKVIHGSVKIISYTEVNQQPLSDEIDMKYPQTRSFYKNIKTVHRNKDIILTESDECCFLSPTDGNIHEIHPETKIAAFLDILAPPYDNDLCCHYYKEMAASKVSDTRWLLEIPQPASYWCDTIDYRGPSLSSYVGFLQRK